MPRLIVGHCRRSFEYELLNAKRFVQEAKTFKVLTRDGAYQSVGIRTIEIIAGLQLLKLHLAWEEFQESVFLRYICGCVSPSGYCPALLGNREQKIAIAASKLFGRYKYLSWGPKETVDRAQKYFKNGEPFSIAISSAVNNLEAVTAVRNRFAHRSEYSQIQFRQLVRSELGFNPPGMTPGRFLLTTSSNVQVGRKTYFDFYADLMLGLAYIMVP